MLEEQRPVEQSTEVPILAPMESDLPAPLDLGRDERAESGTVENDEIEELINPKRKPRAAAPTDPPEPPKDPPIVTLREPAPWLWWVTFGVVVSALAVGVLYVVRARQHEAPGRTDGTDGAHPAPSQPAE